MVKDNMFNTNNTNVHAEFVLGVTNTYQEPNTALSDEITSILQYLLFTVVCQAIDVFGVGSNIINMICFVKQGFKEPVNISLLGLAVSDICCLSTLLWTNTCYTPAFREVDLPFDAVQFQYLITGVPHTVFTRTTGWITAIITMERCLCITLPLKIKTIVTPRRVSAVTIIIFIIPVFSTAPEYIVNRLGRKFFPTRNRTLIGLIYSADRQDIVKVSYLINNVFIPFSSFCIVTVCTAILVVKLRSNSAWRKKSTVTTQAENVYNRNQKISKMVVLISSIFISCFVPVSIIYLAMSLEPEFFIGGKYRNLFVILGAVGIIFESINSAVNIFIYYFMSNKYRVVFHQVFPLFKNIQNVCNRKV